ncbi:putative leucine-rich protein [Moniliophthora roreri MCA 2997]|uniref:Leucine-rich protein n=1 Tax=Moniliophthora roreri (strain MCA 2997) TaxID=1381753 RepID=V2XB51_MONRO|nr:putative leucine-rich protein [Moniliophthora roreri MCA 2997]KAI3596398.1 putative leucine-rich protein [Moniliophthora roreri]
MTEYDYSPEGYERYLDTQTRISQWRDTTEAYRRQYRAPFGARSDVDESEQWDGVSRGSTGPGATLSKGLSQQSSYQVPPSLPVAAPRPSYANPTWVQAPSANYPQQQVPAPAPIIIQTMPSKHKSSSKSHKSHKSSSKSKSKSKSRTYVITPPPSYIPSQYPQQFPQNTNLPSMTYLTTDYAGYPVTQTTQRHQIPGSVYSYSTPPTGTGGSTHPVSYAAPSPAYSSPSPLVSPGASPVTGTVPYLPQGQYQSSGQNMLIIPSSNGAPIRVLY